MSRTVRWTLWAAVALALAANGTRAQAPALPPAPPKPPAARDLAPNPLALLGGGSTDALAGTLRGYLITGLPDPLYEDLHHWGLQKPAGRVVKRKGGGPPHLKNDGRWWKVRVTANKLADTLVLDLRDVGKPEAGRMLFTTFVSFDTQVEYDRQVWRSGVRLYSGSVRARLRLKLALRCEAVARLETKDKLPEMVFRLRVLQSDVGYDNLVVDHVGGLGGEAARVLGDLAKGSLAHWRPSLERELLNRANAAIVKAGDTKEVRVSLGKLLGNDE